MYGTWSQMYGTWSHVSTGNLRAILLKYVLLHSRQTAAASSRVPLITPYESGTWRQVLPGSSRAIRIPSVPSHFPRTASTSRRAQMTKEFVFGMLSLVLHEHSGDTITKLGSFPGHRMASTLSHVAKMPWESGISKRALLGDSRIRVNMTVPPVSHILLMESTLLQVPVTAGLASWMTKHAPPFL